MDFSTGPIFGVTMKRIAVGIINRLHLGKLRLSQTGFTLTELMLAVAIMTIITPAVTMLMVMTMRSFTGYEAEMQLRLTNQATLNRIYLRLGSCKRIIDASADTGYIKALNISGAPVPIGGTTLPNASCVLPTINSAGSLAYNTSSFIPADVGNCLFFANNDSMPTVLSGTSTVKIDVYRFNFYYLSTANPKPIAAAPCYSVVEWQSVQYADYDEVMAVPTTNNWQQNVVAALYAQGIQNAWDANNGVPASSFYTLTSAGGINAVGASPAIPMDSARSPVVLTKMMTGVMFGGFSYGVASNNDQWTGKIKCPKTIPQYARNSDGTNALTSPAPGGFEVSIAGLAAGRSVLMRSVLVAQGSMPSLVADDLETVAMARDVW